MSRREGKGLRLLPLLAVAALCGSCRESREVRLAKRLHHLPVGDAEVGARLLETLGCKDCHGSLAPALDGVGQRAAHRVPGQSARHYLLVSILQPTAFIVPGYERSRRMGKYPLDDQALSDLIEYLLGR